MFLYIHIINLYIHKYISNKVPQVASFKIPIFRKMIHRFRLFENEFIRGPSSTRHNNRNEIPRRFIGNPIRIASHVDLLTTRQDRADYLAVNIVTRPRTASYGNKIYRMVGNLRKRTCQEHPNRINRQYKKPLNSSLFSELLKFFNRFRRY